MLYEILKKNFKKSVFNVLIKKCMRIEYMWYINRILTFEKTITNQMVVLDESIEFENL